PSFTRVGILLTHLARHQRKQLACQREHILLGEAVRAELSIDVLRQNPNSPRISLLAHIEWLSHCPVARWRGSGRAPRGCPKALVAEAAQSSAPTMTGRVAARTSLRTRARRTRGLARTLLRARRTGSTSPRLGFQCQLNGAQRDAGK